MSADLTVYTALLSGYEQLLEQPVAADSGARFVCLTDDPDLASDTWEIRQVRPAFPEDRIRSSRRLKILGYRELETDVSLWIDNSVLLQRDPVELVESWLTEHSDIALPMHSFRTTVTAEADAVIEERRARADDVRAQLGVYHRTAPEKLGTNPRWTAILARRRSADLDAAMERWWDHVCRYTPRDQLSYVVSTAGVRERTVPIDNWTSEWHAWPRAVRTGPVRVDDDVPGTAPDAPNEAAIERFVEQFIIDANASVSARDALIVELQRQLAQARTSA